MGIVSVNETALLFGKMSKINLPDDVELYLSLGISQLYQRVSYSVSEKNERDWLHVPNELLAIYEQSNINNSNSSFNNTDPQACKGKHIFPISSGEKYDIIFVCDSQKLDSVNKRILNSIIDTFNIYKEKHNNYNECNDLFINTLTENNDSISSITKSILNLLVKKIPRSCAGYYSEELDYLQRQVAVGDIIKFEMIPQNILHEVKLDWENNLSNDNHFTPVTNLSKDIQFLVNPPDINFIHYGLKSKNSNNYISVVMPGNLSLPTINFLQTIANLFGKLSETSFIKSLPVLDYCKNNMHSIDERLNNKDLFIKLFSLLNKQIRTTRLLLIEKENCIELGFDKNGLFSLNENTIIHLSPNFIKKIKIVNKIKIQNEIEESIYLNEPINTQKRVKSELLYRMVLPDGNESYIAIGLNRDVDAFDVYANYIDDCIEAFSKCIDNLWIQSALSETKHQNRLLKSKMQLTGKLSNGCFNQISSKITVLLAKSDQLKSNLFMNQEDYEFTKLSKQLSAIESSTDSISEYVDSLQSMMSNDEGYTERIHKSSELMKKIPKLLSGYLHQNYINKNISIRIDNLTQMKSGFLLSCIEVYSCVIPIIMSIINASVQDGTIAIEAKRELEASYIKISFNKSLLTSCDFSSFIIEPFNEYGVSADNVGMFMFGNLIISHSQLENEMIEVRIRLKHEINSAVISGDTCNGVLTSV